jgi:streptogramin lyase
MPGAAGHGGPDPPIPIPSGPDPRLPTGRRPPWEGVSFRPMLALRITRRHLIAASVLLSLAFAAPATAEVTPEYFALPAGFTTSFGISAAADGTVWFAANSPGSGSQPAPGIGRLIPSQALPGTTHGVSTFPTPTLMTPSCCANAVRSVAVDRASNRVWFSQDEGIVGYANALAVNPGTSDGMLATQLPGLQDLWDIAVGSGGLAWFTESSAGNVPPYYGDKIASIDMGLNVSEFENIALQGHGPPLDSQRYDAKPEGITTDANGNPWFAEASAGLPGYRIATAPASGGSYSEYLITPCQPLPPCSGSNTDTGPTDVAVAQDGSVWFTNQLKNEVGRLGVSEETFTNYSLTAIDPTLAGGQPRAISVAPDGTLWVAEFGFVSHPNANAIIRIVPSQPTPTATVYKLGAGHAPIGIAPDTQGGVWFSLATDSPPSLIGRLAGVTGAGPPVTEGTPTSTATSTSTTATPGATPPPAPGAHALIPASVGTARVGPPQASGGSVSVEQICLGPPSDPCSLVYLLSAGEYVTGFPGAHVSAAKKKKAKGTVLGREAVSLHGGERRKITVSLNATGKKLLKRKGKLTVFFTATQAGGAGVAPKLLKRVKVTLRAKR